jgi:hypothetical protein
VNAASHRHPPAFQIGIGPQPGLQRWVAVLATVSTLALVAGLAAHESRCWWLLLLLPPAAGLGWRLARIEHRLLQWDGRCWRLAPAGLREPGVPVRIEILIDLGDWLLLRSVVPSARLPRHRCYLPLARSGVGAHWGQLRATLYSAHPDPSSA